MEHTCNACRFQSPSGGFCRRYGRFICDIRYNNEECQEFISRFFPRSRDWGERRFEDCDTEKP